MKDGGFRFHVDYQKIKRCQARFISAIKDKQYFRNHFKRLYTLHAGYWQIAVKEED